MKTQTVDQYETKKQQQLTDDAKQLHGEAAKAGATELSDDDLDKAAGGVMGQVVHLSNPFDIPTGGDIGDVPDYPTLL